MTDKELLELAARAAGIQIHQGDNEPPEGFESSGWNPLMYDAHALRLAVSLQLGVGVFSSMVSVGDDFGCEIHEAIEYDPYATTRRAIVRAAAEIGKRME